MLPHTHPQTIPDIRPLAAEIYRRLLAAYGEPTWRPYYAPMDELVLTFLSQNTSDLNSGRAFEALKARYPTWQAVLDAPVAELAETIRSGGLAQRKAPRIQTGAAPHPGRARRVQHRLPGRPARGRGACAG